MDRSLQEFVIATIGVVDTRGAQTAEAQPSLAVASWRLPLDLPQRRIIRRAGTFARGARARSTPPRIGKIVSAPRSRHAARVRAEIVRLLDAGPRAIADLAGKVRAIAVGRVVDVREVDRALRRAGRIGAVTIFEREPDDLFGRAA